MIYVKKHRSERGTVLAMCDEELLGRMLKEGKRELDLKTHAQFYKGELIAEEEAEAEINSEVYSANIVGERAVSIIIRKGLAEEQQVMSINGVKTLLLFSVS